MTEINFWKAREKKTIEPSLFSTQAEDLAKLFKGENEASKGKKANRRSQIRKFYDEVQRLNGLAQSPQDEWNDILPYVHMLVAKAAYARGRDLVSDT